MQSLDARDFPILATVKCWSHRQIWIEDKAHLQGVVEVKTVSIRFIKRTWWWPHYLKPSPSPFKQERNVSWSPTPPLAQTLEKMSPLPPSFNPEKIVLLYPVTSFQPIEISHCPFSPLSSFKALLNIYLFYHPYSRSVIQSTRPVRFCWVWRTKCKNDVPLCVNCLWCV